MSCHKHFKAFGQIHNQVTELNHGLVGGDLGPNACPNKDERGRWCSACQAKSNRLHDELRAEQNVCTDCISEREAENAHIQATDTIDPSQPWGQHIALTCKNHPDLRWSTKNISYLGARSIFYTSWQTAPECACPMSDLIVVK
jgi:hypothetical protein